MSPSEGRVATAPALGRGSKVPPSTVATATGGAKAPHRDEPAGRRISRDTPPRSLPSCPLDWGPSRVSTVVPGFRLWRVATGEPGQTGGMTRLSGVSDKSVVRITLRATTRLEMGVALSGYFPARFTCSSTGSRPTPPSSGYGLPEGISGVNMPGKPRPSRAEARVVGTKAPRPRGRRGRTCRGESSLPTEIHTNWRVSRSGRGCIRQSKTLTACGQVTDRRPSAGRRERDVRVPVVPE